MMNPFIQKILNEIHDYPETSAEVIEGKDISEMCKETWMIQKNAKTGAIVVDGHLRVQLHSQVPTRSEKEKSDSPVYNTLIKDVYALGDNATITGQNLPVTAQTANQQALWLGKRLNNGDIDSNTFKFRNLGIMAYLGNSKGLFQTGGGSEISGRMAWLIWRGAYSTMSLSWRNKILIPTYW